MSISSPTVSAMPSARPDDAALRHLLESDFHRVTRGVTNAADISAIVTHMVTTSQRVMYDLAANWNKRAALCPLPDELLAVTFAFLPLRDRVTASHVSRAWRHAALAFPSVWCDIDLTSRTRDPAAVVDMMLSRTGNLPVSFSYRHLYRDPECHSALVQAIEKHLHHIASISWMSEALGGKNLTLTQPAPLLSSLVTDMYCYFPNNFLDGRAGCLRVLHVPQLRLPASCAAFSTVTDLRGAAPDFMDDNETLRNLFTLCPRLETLWLTNLYEEMDDHLPHGPAPRSLARLRLSTSSDVCDHAAHYAAWRTPALVHTELIYSAPARRIATDALCALFAAATEMDVYLPNAGGDGAEIALRDKDAALCRLRFAYPARDASSQFAALLGAVEFGHLRAVSADIHVAYALVRGLPRGVERVTLRVHEVDVGREIRASAYPWGALDCLAALAARCPVVASLALDVLPLDVANAPPSTQNARELLAALDRFPEQLAGLPELHVRGFSRVAVSEVEAEPRAGGPGNAVVFDTDT